MNEPGHAYRSGWLGTAQPPPGDTYAHEVAGNAPHLETRRSRYAQASTGWLGTSRPSPGDTYATGQVSALADPRSAFQRLPAYAHYLLIGAGVFSLATIIQPQSAAMRGIKAIGILAGAASAGTLYSDKSVQAKVLPAALTSLDPSGSRNLVLGKAALMGEKYRGQKYALSQRPQPIGTV